MVSNPRVEQNNLFSPNHFGTHLWHTTFAALSELPSITSYLTVERMRMKINVKICCQNMTSTSNYMVEVCFMYVFLYPLRSKYNIINFSFLIEWLSDIFFILFHGVTDKTTPASSSHIHRD